MDKNGWNLLINKCYSTHLRSKFLEEILDSLFKIKYVTGV